MITRILIPVGVMALLGLVFGAGLGYAFKIFGIKLDEAVLRVLHRLPGSNCGACGKAGCAAFAEALTRGEASPSGCVVSDGESRMAIAEILGISGGAHGARQVAVVLCSGGARARDKYEYRGIKRCGPASLVFGGQKACSFGCLGFGDCVRSCPFGAITMKHDGLPVVDPEKCTACGKCVAACPKKLYALYPVSCYHYVKCSSHDTAAAKMKVCKAGCIACFKCQKACPSTAVTVEGNLSRIDPAKCQNMGLCLSVCPTHVINKRG